MDVNIRMNAKNGALAPGTKVSKLPHLMGHKQQAKTSMKGANRMPKNRAGGHEQQNMQMMAADDTGEGLD